MVFPSPSHSSSLKLPALSFSISDANRAQAYFPGWEIILAPRTLFNIKYSTLENQGSPLFCLPPFPRQSPFNPKHSFPSTTHPRLTDRKCLLPAARRKSQFCSQALVPWALSFLAWAISAALPGCHAVPRMINWTSSLDST